MTQKKQTVPFLTFRSGEGLGTPEAGFAIIRYNYGLGRIELSLDGGPYQGLGGGADGYLFDEFLAAPIVPPILDGYLAYIDYTSTELNKISVDSLLALLSSASSSLQAAYEAGNSITTSAADGSFSVSGTEDVLLSSDADVYLTALGSLTLGAGGQDVLWPTLAGTAGTVLTNDGSGNLSWSAPAGGGSVTSVTLAASTTGLTVSGGSSQTITSSGTFTLGGTLAVANGGTGTSSSFTPGSVVFAGTDGAYSQDDANLFWDDVSNYLGIGTPTPVAALDVASGQLAIPDGSAAAPSLAFRDDLNTGLFSPANDVVGVGVNGTEIARLQQFGAASTAVFLLGTTAPIGAISGSGNISVDSVSPDATSGVVMLARGNVGTVIQESYRGGQFAGVRTSGTKISPSAVVAGEGLWNGIGVGYTTAGGYNYGALVTFKAEETYTASASGGRIEFHTTTNGTDGFTTLGGSTTERMRITNAGFVGIATSAPTTRLSVAEKFQVDSVGNIVKVNNVTTSFPPSQGGAGTVLTNDGSGGLSWSAASTGTITGSGTASQVAFFTSASAIGSEAGTGTDALTWDASSNSLGIGTATPTAKLHVSAGTLLTGSAATKISATLANPGSSFESGLLVDVVANGSANSLQFASLTTLTGTYTGAQQTTALSFRNDVAGTDSSWYNDSLGMRPGGNRGVVGHAVATTSGNEVGLIATAGGGALNFGGFTSASIDKPSAKNIGFYAAARNTVGTEIGVFAHLYSSSTAPTFESAALLADNGSGNSPIFIARDNGTEVFRIADDGNVGIGTTTPSSKLEIAGNAATIGQSITNASTTGVSFLNLLEPAVSGGNVSWQYRNQASVTAGLFTASQGLLLADTGATGGLLIGSLSTSAPIVFCSGGFLAANERLRFGPNAVVVNENGENVDFRVASDTNTNMLFVDASANAVGISTASPTATFSVAEKFQVDSNGNILKIKNVTTNWPPTQGSLNSVLTNDGSGNLSWASASSQNNTAPIATKTANYTMTSSDGTVLADASSGAITITLPAVASSAERIFTIKKKDVTANIVTVDANASELIDGSTTYLLSTQYEAIKIQSDGTAWWII